MILGRIDTAATHYVGANGCLFEMLQFTYNLPQLENAVPSGYPIGSFEDLFVNVHYSS